MIRCNFLICSKHAVSVNLILRHDNREYKKSSETIIQGIHLGIGKAGGI